MNHNGKYILGGGISGLVFGFYNRDFTVISPEIGGKLSNDYLSGTIFIHDSPETRKLLTDLDIPLKLKTHVIKYYCGKELKDNISNLERQKIINKKLSMAKIKHGINRRLLSDRTLSYNDNFIPILDIDYNQLIKKLQRRVKYIKDVVIRLTDDEIICEENRFAYSQLISTVPAPIFWKLYRQNKDLKSLPVTFVLSPDSPLPQLSEHWDLVYFTEDCVPYSRVNLTKDNNYLYEFSGEISISKIRKLLSKLKIIKYFVDPYGIIFSDMNNIPPPKIRFLGRFAVWDHRIRINNVIKQALAQYDFVSVWNKQKNFNLNFFDFNVRDEDKQQELTKDFALRLVDEVHELLSKINWKEDEHKTKKIRKEKVLEEWIDIFKYWLGLGNVWGFEIEDFFEEFWRKSLVVDNRYKKHLKKSYIKNS